MASSTTNPTESVSASSDRLSRLNPNGFMSANVPTTDSGSARLGISVAEALRRNRKITSTTSSSVMSRVVCTSPTECRIDTERSLSVSICTEPGNWGLSFSTMACTRSATRTVFVPGWRWIASTIARLPLNQLATRLSCTPSSTVPRSPSRTMAPASVLMMRLRNSRALSSWPSERRVSALSGPHRTPVGRLTLPDAMAPETWSMPTPRAASAWGSSWMRTAYF